MPNPRPYSPEWWRNRLLVALDNQQKRVERLERYNDGNHPLPSPPRAMAKKAYEEASKAFKTLSQLGVTNWVRLIAKAPSERLAVRGFRFGESLTGDDAAWLIWQRNHMDADSRLLFDTALVTGQAYGLVWPDANNKAEITLEHPCQMIVAYEAGSRRKRAAALKRWVADDGRVNVTLYLPAELYKWQSASTRPAYGVANFAYEGMRWDPRQPTGEEWPLPNPVLGPDGKPVVPVVECAVNTGLRARPFGGGCGEFEPVLSIQDRINKTIFDRLVTGEFQAFRQRYVIGWTPPTDPETGQPDPRLAFEASQSRMWTFPKSAQQVGEFAQADFTGFIKAVENDVNAMAAITQTPPHYLLGAMVNISGDALTAAESGLASKSGGHRDGLSESLEEIMQLSLSIEGDPRASDVQTQVLWNPVEVRTLAEQVDAVLKLKGTIPDEALWSMLPADIASDQDIRRWKAQRAATSLFAPPPTSVPGGNGQA